MVWVSCHGRDSADEEVIGDIEYYPKLNGFPDYYYPYTNTPGYLSPLVAVRFLRPKSEYWYTIWLLGMYDIYFYSYFLWSI